MIKIEVEGYCQNCLNFQPDVIRPERLRMGNDGTPTSGDTIVRCEYRQRCAGIKRYLEHQMKKEQEK